VLRRDSQAAQRKHHWRGQGKPGGSFVVFGETRNLGIFERTLRYADSDRIFGLEHQHEVHILATTAHNEKRERPEVSRAPGFEIEDERYFAFFCFC
jgi:hypothetical protein